MARSTPVARETGLTYQSAEGVAETLAVGSSAWYDWLADATHRHFAFHGHAGRFTARKERRQRGGWYWTAYRQVAGKLHKAYLGKSEELSLERLEAVAAALLGREVQPLPSPPSDTPLSASEAAPGARPSQLLVTKLFVPHPPPRLVARPRLTTRLDAGLVSRLTLVSAPAGFGKTTLVSEWVATIQRPTAWLSLDEGDSDPTRFLTYLVAALQTMAPDIGEGALRALQSPQPPPTEAILTALLNEISALPDKLLLVLDDYHVVDAKPVDLALTFLLERLPPQLHLVITTREDPPLPLARLRARGQLTELRAADLRFTPAEAAAFLSQVMDLDLSAEDVTALEDHTEGWIAGLQLAALSMRGRDDVRGFVRAFAGDHRYIVDYLVGEVLQRQPEPVRSFLLQTAILDRLTGALCDAVVDHRPRTPDHAAEVGGGESSVVRGLSSVDGVLASPSSQSMLDYLERGNFFVVPLDDQRRWYRYHHLFADVLRAHLMAEQPQQVATLHRRASEWYEQNGSTVDAIRHALAAEDFERAAGLVERAWPAMDQHFQAATWLGWAKALPDELVRARPVLSLAYAWAFLNGGELEAAEARVRDTERWLGTTADGSEMVVVDEAQFRTLPASVATARSYLAQARGDLPGSVAYGRRALDLLPEGDHLRRGPAAALLGLAYWASGDLAAAYRALADAMAGFQKVGNLHFAISVTSGLADIRTVQGRLREAVKSYAQALQLALEPGEPLIRGTANLYLGLSELYHEQGNLEVAIQHLLRSEALGEPAALPGWRYRLCRAQARFKEAQGDLTGALDLLDEAERHYHRTPVPDVRPLAALKTRVGVAQGRLSEARRWAHEQGLSVDDELSFLREFDHITLARVLMAEATRAPAHRAMREALRLLDRLQHAAEAGGRMGSVIEIGVLQALAYQAQGDMRATPAPLARALTLAEPEGYVRIFVDEGPPMAALLEQAVKQGIAPNYVRQLLTALGKVEDRVPATQGLIEPLSDRELDVLRLLGTDLNGPDIARELMVSLNTLRTHTKNIYAKLGVHDRRAAVRRAEEMALL